MSAIAEKEQPSGFAGGVYVRIRPIRPIDEIDRFVARLGRLAEDVAAACRRYQETAAEDRAALERGER